MEFPGPKALGISTSTLPLGIGVLTQTHCCRSGLIFGGNVLFSLCDGTVFGKRKMEMLLLWGLTIMALLLLLGQGILGLLRCYDSWYWIDYFRDVQ